MSEPAQDDRPNVTRRILLGGGLTAAAAAAVWWSVKQSHQPIETGPLLAYVCDQTIPATDTPGALAAGVPAFVTLGLGAGLADAKGDELERLAKELDQAAGGSFMKLEGPARLAALTRHDAACFAPAAATGTYAWPTIKRLIVMGYYTSEIGASQEQRYELDIGEFRPDLPYKKGDRAYSNAFHGLL